MDKMERNNCTHFNAQSSSTFKLRLMHGVHSWYRPRQKSSSHVRPPATFMNKTNGIIIFLYRLVTNFLNAQNKFSGLLDYCSTHSATDAAYISCSTKLILKLNETTAITIFCSQCGSLFVWTLGSVILIWRYGHKQFHRHRLSSMLHV